VAEYDPLLDTVALAELLQIPASTLRSWGARNKLSRRGRDSRGRTLYSVLQASELAERAAPKAA
jgi:hypothetical protein